MGKGDQKTARGKRFAGSYGKNRKRKPSVSSATKSTPKAKVEKVESKASAPAAKKPAAKKPSTKKPSKKDATA